MALGGADKLIIEIDGDTSPLAGALGSIQNVGKKAFLGMTGAITGAAVAIGGLVKSAVQSYADFEQLTGGVETLFGTSADIVFGYAEQAYKTAGLSANQYMENVTAFSASLLQSVAGDTAEAARVADMAMIDMADNANKMGTSMRSIQDAYQGFAKQNYTMLDNLKLGYGGTKTEMERLLADAEKLTGVKYDISNLNDVFEAIHVIQDEIGITGTTVFEAEQTISGSLNAAKAAWANLITGIADDNQDFEGLIDNFVNSVGIAASNLLPRIEMAITGVGRLISGLLPVVVDQIPVLIDSVLPDILDSATNVVFTLLQGITDNLPLITAKAPELMWALFNGIMAMLPMVGTIAQQLIGTFVQGFLMYNALIFELGLVIIVGIAQGLAENAPMIVVTAVELINTLTEALVTNIPLLIEAAILILNGLTDGLLENLPVILESALLIVETLVLGLIEAIPQLVDAAVTIVQGLSDFLIENLPLIIETGITLLIALVEAMPVIVSTIVAALPQIINGIIDALLSNLPLIVQAGVTLLIALIENIDEIVSTIITAVPEIIGGIVEAFADNKDALLQAGKDLINGLWKGIKSAWDVMKGWVSDIADSVVNIFKGNWNIQSPSRVFMQLGNFLMEGLEEGLADGLKDVLETATDITKQIEKQFGFDTDKLMTSVDFGAGLRNSALSGAATMRGITGISASNIINQPNRSTTYTINAMYKDEPVLTLSEHLRIRATLEGAA